MLATFLDCIFHKVKFDFLLETHENLKRAVPDFHPIEIYFTFYIKLSCDTDSYSTQLEILALLGKPTKEVMPPTLNNRITLNGKTFSGSRLNLTATVDVRDKRTAQIDSLHYLRSITIKKKKSQNMQHFLNVHRQYDQTHLTSIISKFLDVELHVHYDTTHNSKAICSCYLEACYERFWQRWIM